MESLRKEGNVKKTATVLVVLVVACSSPDPGTSPPGEAMVTGGRTHADLVQLYEEFRDFRVPEISEGVPDYTADAMHRKHEGLGDLMARLAAIDTAGWSIPERVDYMVVLAEMNGMDFDHRVLRPWSSDPAFYVVINFQFGPKMYGARGLPSLPVDQAAFEEARLRLRAIPGILEQARRNLTEPKPDQTMLGIRTKDREDALLSEFLAELPEHSAELVPDAEVALAAIREFRGWLQSIEPGLSGPSGLGPDQYTWFMHNVMLLPHSWEEAVTIAERDLDRALALMAFAEHRNRNLPPFDIIDSPVEYIRRHTAAQQTLLDFVEREEIMTIPDFIEVNPPGGGGNRTGTRDYFQNVNDRDPMALLPHDFLVHTPDARRRGLDDRPIRGQPRLYFVDGQRQDGLATAMEQILMHLGSLEGRPRADELAHNLLALRAVRALGDLAMHGNEMALLEAFQYNIENTPKGWLPDDSQTMWHDLELYLRQPGYGLGYLIGVAQIEALVAERARQLGDDFVMKTFFDDFLAAGLIPISLIHWELTGNEDVLSFMREPSEE
jgi:hypothetical protein